MLYTLQITFITQTHAFLLQNDSKLKKRGGDGRLVDGSVVEREKENWTTFFLNSSKKSYSSSLILKFKEITLYSSF